jgi:hypothetical protein
MLRFNLVAIILVLAAWWWRRRVPVPWSVLRRFYGVAWTLFGLNFLLDNISHSNPAGMVLSLNAMNRWMKQTVRSRGRSKIENEA